MEVRVAHPWKQDRLFVLNRHLSERPDDERERRVMDAPFLCRLSACMNFLDRRTRW